MQHFRRLFFILSLLLLTNAHANVLAHIDYTAVGLGGNVWRYDYIVRNLGASSFDEVTIHFNADAYIGLSLLSTPVGWDSLVAQPDPAIPSNGFFDSLSSFSLLSGDTASGFSVLFNFLGAGTPSTQPFDIVDPNTFGVLASGQTTPLVSTFPVSEPTSGSLVAAGILLLLLMRRRTA